MAHAETTAESLKAALVAAGIDPTGLDLAFLAGIKDETEQRIAAHRSDPGYTAAAPAFNPPKEA